MLTLWDVYWPAVGALVVAGVEVLIWLAAGEDGLGEGLPHLVAVEVQFTVPEVWEKTRTLTLRA